MGILLPCKTNMAMGNHLVLIGDTPSLVVDFYVPKRFLDILLVDFEAF